MLKVHAKNFIIYFLFLFLWVFLWFGFVEWVGSWKGRRRGSLTRVCCFLVFNFITHNHDYLISNKICLFWMFWNDANRMKWIWTLMDLIWLYRTNSIYLGSCLEFVLNWIYIEIQNGTELQDGLYILFIRTGVWIFNWIF